MECNFIGKVCAAPSLPSALRLVEMSGRSLEKSRYSAINDVETLSMTSNLSLLAPVFVPGFLPDRTSVELMPSLSEELVAGDVGQFWLLREEFFLRFPS